MSLNRHFNPWQTARVSPADVRHALDRFFQLNDSDQARAEAGHWAPRVDIREDDKQFVILADIPGVDPGQIEVSMDKGVLSIKGERPDAAADTQGKFTRVERARGGFHRRVCPAGQRRRGWHRRQWQAGRAGNCDSKEGAGDAATHYHQRQPLSWVTVGETPAAVPYRRGFCVSPGSGEWNSKTITKFWASSPMPARPRSRPLIASLRANTIRTRTRKAAPKTNSRQSTRPTRCSRTPRSGAPMISCAPAAIVRVSSSGRRRVGRAQSQGFGDGGDGDFSDFFESLFGRGAAAGHRGQPRPRRGQDVQASVQIDLQTAFDGGKTRLAMHDPSGGERVLEVKIPAGIQPGQVIRLSGQGQGGMAGGPNGDLLLEVGIRDDPRFRLDGRNVVHVLPITPWEAALGATVPVPTLAGTVDLRIPPASQSGRKLASEGARHAGCAPGRPAGGVVDPCPDGRERRAARGIRGAAGPVRGFRPAAA